MRKKSIEKLDSRLAALQAEQLKVKKELADEKKRRDAASIKALGQVVFNAGLAEWDHTHLREVMEALAAHGPSPVLVETIRALPRAETSQTLSE